MTEEEMQQFRESLESMTIAIHTAAVSFLEAMAPVINQLGEQIRESLNRSEFVLSDEEREREAWKRRKFHEHYGTGGDFWKKEDPDE